MGKFFVGFVVIIQLFILGNISLNINNSKNSPINIYIFKGDGCPHCANAINFFESIDEEYGRYFNLIEYEVWNNRENENLMKKVGHYLNADVSGVPFIVIGTDYYSGFTEEWEDDIKKNILDEYSKNEKKRIDVVKLLSNNDFNINFDDDSLFSKVNEEVIFNISLVTFLMSSVVLV